MVVSAILAAGVLGEALVASRYSFFRGADGKVLPGVLTGLHRSGMHRWPENTEVAFREAGRAHPGALLETDVTSTKDGVAVLLHDDTVDRTTDGSGRVSEMDFADLRKLDGGYRFSTDGGASFPWRGKGLRVATLAEALRAAPRSRFFIDLKPETRVADVVRVVREAGAQERVLFASFVPALAAEARRLAPEIPVCYDTATGLRLLAALRGGDWAGYVPQAPVLSLMVEHVEQYRITDEEIGRIRGRGILVQIHTLNTRESVGRWAGLVDGFLTDEPALLP